MGCQGGWKTREKENEEKRGGEGRVGMCVLGERERMRPRACVCGQGSERGCACGGAERERERERETVCVLVSAGGCFGSDFAGVMK